MKQLNDYSYSVYEDVEHGFRLRFPQDWVARAYHGMGLVLVAPKQNRVQQAGESSLSCFSQHCGGSTFETNVTVTYQGLPSNCGGLGKYVQTSLRELERALDDLTLESVMEESLACCPAKKLVYTARFRNHEIRFLQYVTVADLLNMAYTITFGASADCYATYLSIVTNIIGSFEIFESDTRD